MLIRFFVENFLSFKERVEFSMVAGRSRMHPDHVVQVGKPKDLRLLKTGVVFGANQSGKTNLIKAMSFAQECITTGSIKTEHQRLTPFLLDSASPNKPSMFEFEFKCGIAMDSFRYGFVVDSNRVHSEWLYEITPASEIMMFERNTNSRSHTDVKLGKVNVLVTNDEEPFDFVPKVRHDQLFLWVGNQTDGRIAFLDIIYDWFDRTLVPVFPDSIPTQGIGFGIMKDSDLEHRLKDILEVLDLGIDGVHLHQITADVEKDLTEEYKQFAESFIEDIPKDSDERAIFGQYGSERYLTLDAKKNYTAFELVTLHKVSDENRMVAFHLDAESDGTRRLLDLIPALLQLHVNVSDHVFVIDELDRSVHTHLSYKILSVYLASRKQDRSQLIVTTHDTGLLSFDLLRRDEIWFIEKDRYGASSLYSLEEFELPTSMNIEKGYLGGRFGAIPIQSIFDELEMAE